MLSLFLMMQVAAGDVSAVKEPVIETPATEISCAAQVMIPRDGIIIPFGNSPAAWAQANTATRAVAKAEAEVATEEAAKSAPAHAQHAAAECSAKEQVAGVVDAKAS